MVEGRGLECQAEKETGLRLLTLSRRRGRMQRGGPLPERHLYQHRRLFRVHLSSGTPRRPRPRLLSRCEAPPWPDPSLLCLWSPLFVSLSASPLLLPPSPFLRLPPPASNSALPSLTPQPVLLSLLATLLPARRFPHLTAPPPPSDIDECRERGPALCGSQRCENSPGSYRCVRDCDPGYHAGPEGTCDGETTAPAPTKSFLDDQGGAPGFT